MFWKEKVCVPTELTGKVIRTHHATIGHVGGDRLWTEMGRWYNFSPSAKASELTKKIPGQCEICQAHNPSPGPLKGEIEPTIVSHEFGDRLSLDCFEMPLAAFEGVAYDCMAVAVCRTSGWTGVVGLREGNPYPHQGTQSAPPGSCVLWPSVRGHNRGNTQWLPPAMEHGLCHQFCR